jgi:hypothetical protein
VVGDVVREQERVDVVPVLCVQLHDLQLRHQELRERHGHGLDREPLRHRQDVAHLEGPDEDVHLPRVRLVVEEEPAGAVHRVEGSVRLVAFRDEELGDAPALALRRDEVDVAYLAPEGRVEVVAGVQHDRHAAQHAQRDSRALGGPQQAHRLLGDVIRDGAVHAQADSRRQSSTGSVTRHPGDRLPSSWSISPVAAARPSS